MPVISTVTYNVQSNAADELLQVFTEVAKIERALSEAKRNLMYKVEFNLVDAYRMFEQDGYINAASLRKGLDDIGLYPTKKEV